MLIYEFGTNGKIATNGGAGTKQVVHIPNSYAYFYQVIVLNIVQVNLSQ